MILEQFRETNLPNGGQSLVSQKTSFIYWLANGHQLVTSGGLRVQFDQFGKIDVLEILTTSHEEFVPRAQLLRTATESPEMKHSPNQTKTSGKKGQQRQKAAQTAQEQVPVAAIPRSTINDQGVTRSVQQFLEVPCVHNDPSRYEDKANILFLGCRSNVSYAAPIQIFPEPAWSFRY